MAATLSAVQNLTLDGVAQGPGTPEEDTRDGFTQGGWAGPYQDPSALEVAGEGMAQTAGVLFGRRTYENFEQAWGGGTGNPFSAFLDATPKYVASRTLSAPLSWANSTLLQGELAASVTALKESLEGAIVVLGSNDVLRQLLRADLVDSLSLSIHPLVLGSGRQLFPEGLLDGGIPQRFTCTSSMTTSTGVIIANYTRER